MILAFHKFNNGAFALKNSLNRAGKRISESATVKAALRVELGEKAEKGIGVGPGFNTIKPSKRMQPKPDEIIPTRESLLGRLKDWKDEESWREFFNIYRKLIFSMAVKAGLSEPESEEVVQETLISIAKTIKGFEYDPERCSFKSWLRHLAQKRIADCFRKRSREELMKDHAPDETGKTPVMERVPDTQAEGLDAIWEETWQRELLETAISRMKSQVSAEQYQIFDFYVLKKMPVGKVARALNTNAAQVYLVKHRITKLIKREIARLEEKMG